MPKKTTSKMTVVLVEAEQQEALVIDDPQVAAALKVLLGRCTTKPSESVAVVERKKPGPRGPRKQRVGLPNQPTQPALAEAPAAPPF